MKPLFTLTFFTFLLLLPDVSIAQNVDSLRSSLATATGKKRITTLNDLSFNLAQADANQAEAYAQEALELALDLPWLEGQIDAYYKLALVARYRGLIDKAIAFSDSANVSLESNPNKAQEAAVAANLGVCYRSKGDYEKALLNFQKAIQLQEKLGQEEELGSTYNNLGVMYMYLEDYKNAIVYYDRALAIQLRHDNKRELAKIWNNYAIVYANQELLDSALVYFIRSFEMEEAMGNLRGMSEGFNNIGAVYYYQGDDDRAIDAFRKSYAIDSVLGDIKGQITTINNIAEMYTSNGETEEALRILERSLKMAREIDAKPEIAIALINHAGAYQKAGDYQKAFDFLYAYTSVHDSVLGENQQRTIAEMETAYQTREKEQQIKIQKLQLIENEISLAQRRNAIIGLGLGILLLVLLGFASYQIIQNKRTAELQTARMAEKELQLKAVIDATESERRRIARELHDGIGQQITSIKLGLNNFMSKFNEPGDDQDKLKKIMLATDQSATDLRALAHQMMPRSLAEMGLVPALRDMVEKAFSLSEVAYEFEAINADLRYNAEIELVVYRVAQELVNNILKHAQASRVSMALSRRDHSLELILRDNGKGRINTINNKGLGMVNMKTRLAQIGGQLSFEDLIPQGMEASVLIPFEKQNA